MTKADFLSSINNPSPPDGIDPLLRSLWYDAKGDWNKAHEIVQELGNKAASWIHGYLHRKEGDLINAEYWYMKAEHNIPEIEFDFEKEWNEILDFLSDLLEAV